MSSPLPRLYGELAAWYPLLTAPPEYAEEAAFYLKAMRDGCEGPLRRVLELGAGAGALASHYKPGLEVTLTDLSPEMLAHSRALNPDCEHVPGDMRTLRLGREFDAVMVHDAVCYMTDEAALREVLETAFAHLRPGGVAVFAPDCTRESFVERTDDGGSDGAQGRLRWFEWTHDADPGDTTYQVEYALMIEPPGGPVRCEHDHHEEGLFARDAWLRLLGEVGFSARLLEPVDFEGVLVDCFVAVRPRAPAVPCP